jgi:hypothetical protein
VKSILTTLLVVLLVQPASALARGNKVLVPPGDSAASQYVETVPTDRGGALPGSGQQPNALTPGQRSRLDALGPDGRQLVAVVQATSPPPAAGAPAPGHGAGRTNAGDGTAVAATGAPGSTGSTGSAGALSSRGVPSTVGLVLTAATGAGSGGLGIFLPLLLGATALGVLLLAVRRWRA